MDKRELITKMQVELANYQIGLHNISVSSYKNVLKYLDDNSKKEQWEITGGQICEKAIAQHIVDSGLYVFQSRLGLKTTVSKVKELSKHSLDYTYNAYNSIKQGAVWNVIVALPYILQYEGNDYFIGDIDKHFNVGNTCLFNEVLPKEFIYGYYKIELVKAYLQNRSCDCFGDNIDFFGNPNFFGYLDEKSKCLLFRKILEEKRQVIEYLNLSNSDENLKKLIKCKNIFDKNERIRVANLRQIIDETREQRKLFYGEK